MTRTLLSEAEGYELLNTYGIPVPGYVVVATAEEAGPAAEEIGFPLVAKIVSPQVSTRATQAASSPASRLPLPQRRHLLLLP